MEITRANIDLPREACGPADRDSLRAIVRKAKGSGKIPSRIIYLDGILSSSAAGACNCATFCDNCTCINNTRRRMNVNLEDGFFYSEG